MRIVNFSLLTANQPLIWTVDRSCNIIGKIDTGNNVIISADPNLTVTWFSGVSDQIAEFWALATTLAPGTIKIPIYQGTSVCAICSQAGSVAQLWLDK